MYGEERKSGGLNLTPNQPGTARLLYLNAPWVGFSSIAMWIPKVVGLKSNIMDYSLNLKAA